MARVRARSSSPTWVRASLLALLAATAVLYLWDLGASGWANAFYSAAVQAGTKSWTAFLFGSFDSSNFITVDKPPASLWVMELSARIFGVNAWSILVPQALEGVAAVGLLFATVRRRAGPVAGLIAGAVLATTPVAALMFRFNNPDALLVLLLVGSAYALTRALERGATCWLVLAGSLVGFGFLTKMLQAFVVLPVFAAVYLLAGPVPVRKRIWQTLAAGAATIVPAGWWVALVTLWPAADRPYIGGSTDNSVLNLIFGYNGFGRITGNETGSVGGSGTAGSMWGPTGITRLFITDFGTQASWLIPSALILLVAALVLRRRAPRTDGLRAQLLIWGGWLVLTGLLLSFAQGIIHPYYTVALAPAIGALIGIGAVAMWVHRSALRVRLCAAASLLAATVWSFVLLSESPSFLPWLRLLVLVAGCALAAVLVAAPLLRKRSLIVVALAAVVTVLAAPTAYAIDTALTPHSGALPTAGPAITTAQGFGPGAGLAPRGFGGGPGAGFAGGFPRFGNGTFAGPAPGGGGGGLLNASTPDAATVAALQQHASSYQWVAATVGANDAAGYQLATGDPVMAIGGFNGTDPWPTLAAFESLVSQHKIHYFVVGGSGGGPGAGGSGSSSAIVQWVEANFTAQTIGNTTLYDVSQGA